MPFDARPMASGPAEWVARRGRWTRGLLALLAGMVMTAGHAPLDFPWGFFIAVPLLVWLLDAAPTTRGALWTGYAAGYGYFLTSFHWIGHAFLVDVERFGWLMPFAVASFPAGLAIFWAVGAYVARRALWAEGPLRVAGLAVALTLVEYARGHVLTGLPWALPGYVWVETPVMQIASWAGSYGTTLLTFLIAGLPFVAMVGQRHRIWPGSAAFLALGALWAWGSQRVPEAVTYAADAPMVRIVQPGGAIQSKSAYPALTLYRNLRLMAQPGDPDVIVLPEIAVTYALEIAPGVRRNLAAAAGGAVVIAGAYRVAYEPPPRRLYNSLYVIGPRGELLAVYDKHHLVPFGEYLPLPNLMAALGLAEIAQAGGFAAGPGPRLIEIPGLPGFSPLICYEMVFPQDIMPRGAPRPDWLVHVTQDAWFGNFAGPQQHLAQARIRSIEFGLPAIRSANTGISAVVDPYGRNLATLALNTTGTIDQKLPSSIPETTYSRLRDAPLLVVCILLLCVSYYYANIRQKD